MIYLCATPIGNLEDITKRVERVLRECDAVYAEDTRHTLALLNHLGIKKPVFSCHEHNERARAAEIVARSKAGENVAVVSDAGMPGISDPGAAVVREAIDAGEPFTVLPGASAALASAVMSGFSCERFVFEGFLPRDNKQRNQRINSLLKEERTAVIYESPLRLFGTLKELAEKLGNRNAAVCLELTKLHEECVRGTLFELAGRFSDGARGECVIVLAGAAPETEAPADIERMIAELKAAELAGERVKEAAKRVAAGIAPSALYNEYLRRKRAEEV